jgi:hypothetical protein
MYPGINNTDDSTTASSLFLSRSLSLSLMPSPLVVLHGACPNQASPWVVSVWLLPRTRVKKQTR